MLKFRSKQHLASIEKEIYQAISFLQNYMILQNSSPKGAIYTIEQLMSYMDKLKPPLEILLHYMRINRRKDGIQSFIRQVESKYAEGFVKLLVALDDLTIIDIRETLEMYRRNIKEETITREKQKNETISDLIYIPIMCNVMLVFINFIYIAYYSQQKELFQGLLF